MIKSVDKLRKLMLLYALSNEKRGIFDEIKY